DQVRVGRDLQVADVDLTLFQPVDLLEQYLRVEHHPVADRAGQSLVEDPRRDQVEFEDVPVPDDRVPGIVATLKTDHQVGPLGEQVDDLSLSFIAPLGANDYETWHGRAIVGSAGRA